MPTQHVIILGQNIRIVRPEKYKAPFLPKEPFKPLYDTTPKTREIGVAEFLSLCLFFNRPVARPAYWRR